MFWCCAMPDHTSCNDANTEMPEAFSEPPTEATASSRAISLGEEFQVEIERASDTSLGLQFYHESLPEMSGIVCDVMYGSLCGIDVKKGDRLVEVDGCRESFENMIKLIKGRTSLKLTFKRPKEFAIELAKPIDLGVELAMSRDSDFLVIKNFQSSGALPDFNQTRSADRAGRVRRLDCIIEVNGYRGPCTQMLERIQQETCLKLKCVRYHSKIELDSICHLATIRKPNARIGGA